MVVFQVPGDSVRPGVQTLPGQLFAQLGDQADGGIGDGPRGGLRAPRPWLERGLPSVR